MIEKVFRGCEVFKICCIESSFQDRRFSDESSFSRKIIQGVRGLLHWCIKTDLRIMLVDSDRVEGCPGDQVGLYAT